MNRRFASLIVACACACACSADGPGAVRLQFEWPAAARPDFARRPLYARGRLQVWPDGDAAGARTLSEAGPVPLDEEGQGALRFTDLTLGADRVLVVEVRDDEADSGPVLHYGVSAPFALRSGESVDVVVVFELRPAPGREPGDSGDETDRPGLGLAITHERASAGRVPEALVTLRIRAANADSLTVANGPGLFVGARSRPLAELRPVADGLYEWPEPWDLDAGLPDDVRETDGPRQVFLRLSNRLGLHSDLTEATVVLDRAAPVLDVVANGAHFNGTDVVRVTVSATELLSGPPELLVEADDFTLRPAAGPSEGLSYTFTVPAADLPEDGRYDVRLRAADVVGNATAWQTPLSFEVDRTAPGLAAQPIVESPLPAPDGRLHARVGTPIVVTLAADEPLDETATEVSLGGLPLESEDGARWTGVVTGAEPEGPEHLRGVLVDRAGNRSALQDVLAAPIEVRLDFTAPTLVGTPVVERDDGFAPARLAANAVLAQEGTAVTVTFAVVEPLHEAPTLRVNGAAGPAVAGAAPIFTATIPAGAPEGQAVLDAAARDMAGNAALLRLATVDYDYTPPAAPDVETAGRIVYARAPWGSTATDGEPSFTVAGGPGALAEPGTVFVFDRAAEPRVELVRAAGDEAGFGPIALRGEGLAVVCVALQDRAGNLGACAEVRDGVWTATMGRKVPGSPHENPATLLATGDLAPTPAQDDAVSGEPTGDALGRLARAGDEALVVEAAFRWQELARPTRTPPPRQRAAAAYDAARGRVVLFGGADQGAIVSLRDTWEWDGRGWRELVVETRPPARWRHALAYDARRGRSVLFGGELLEDGTRRGDTWEFDGERWLRRDPPESPSPRLAPAMAYDAARGVTVLFGGGRAGRDTLADTWEWDGETWVQRTPAEGPPPRQEAALVYDPVRRVSLLFGGRGNDDASLADTWVWDGAAWQAGPAEDAHPPAAAGALLVWDAGRERAVLLRGFRGTAPDDLLPIWEWDGERWTERLPAAGPVARFAPAAAYDVLRGETVICGGWGGQGELDDTWTWDGAAWTERDPLDWPHSRHAAALAYDTARRRSVLFGGRTFTFGPDGSERRDLADTWAFDGRVWRALGGEGGPEPGAWPLAYDAARERVVLFGGRDEALSDAETCRGATFELLADEWVRREPAQAPPCAAAGALAYDAGRERVVLAGAREAAGPDAGRHVLWEWDGADWARVVVPEPDPLGDVAFAAYDDGGARVLLADGPPGCRVGAWDGATLTPLAGAFPGECPADGARAFDALRGRLLLFGGHVGAAGQGTEVDDTWEWDGAEWALLAPTAAPAPVTGAALTYDPDASRSVLFGGSALVFESDELWTWEGGAASRPAAVWSVPWAEAGVAAADVQTVRLRAVAGGRGTTAGAPVAGVVGAELLVFEPLGGRWRVVASNPAAPESPAELVHALDGDDAFRALLLGPSQALYAAVAPAAPAGAGAEPRRVALDVLELEVRYRRPALSPPGP